MFANSIRFKMAGEQLQQSELFYRSLIAGSLDGILLTDEKGIIKFISPSVKKIMDYDPADITGHNIFQYVHPDDHELAASSFRDEIIRKPKIKFISIRLLKKNGEWLWCLVRGNNMLNNQHIGSMAVYINDDTKRKEIEEKLIKSENIFRNLIYNLNHGLLVMNEKGKVIVCNYAAQYILGLTESQLLGSDGSNPKWNAVNENGQHFPVENFPDRVAMRTKQPVYDVVIGVLKGSSSERVWLLVNASPSLDEHDQIMNVIISFTDITERKKLSQQLIEQEIQKQKQLTQATIFGQEKERREIGKELHDNINQHLTTTRLYLEVAMEKAAGEVKEMISLSHKSLTDTINEIRLMSQSLVPPTLGDLGLIESVQDLCDALKRAHTFSVDFNCRYFNEDNLPGELRLILFRIVQEQINNIIRHASATYVQIKLQSDAEYIILTITDNGQGFDTGTVKRGLGFSNISNRADLFNGKVEIESTPGNGCILTVIIPQLHEEMDTN